MKDFHYRGLPSDVYFGAGTLERLPAIVAAHGKRALILTTPEQEGEADRLAELLGSLAIGRFCEAAMHTPVDVTDRAVVVAREARADVVVAIGGGSTIGLGKAITRRANIGQIAIPTTYAGSEMTPILGETQGGLKTTIREDRLLPRAILYDVDLTLGLPTGITGTSGLNAIAHAVEGLYAQDTNPVMQLIAEDGIRALASALGRLAQDGGDREARFDALYGAWLCGMVLGSVGMALHHKLCHTLGGTFELPHSPTHAIILPHAIAYNAGAVPAAMERLERALGSPDPAGVLFDLGRSVGAPAGLRDLGMPEAGIDRTVDLAIHNPYWNPRPIEREPLRAMLARAWAGERP